MMHFRARLISGLEKLETQLHPTHSCQNYITQAPDKPSNLPKWPLASAEYLLHD